MVTASAPAPAPAPAAAHAPPAGAAGAAGPPALHALPAAEVWAALASRPQGLRPSEAAERLGRSGPNAIREVRGRPLVFKLLANFTHLMALLLWAGGAVGFVAGMPQLGVAIWLVNLINGAFSFWQEYRAERATAALSRLLPAQARVLRDGVECPVPAESLVPGDVLLLAEGDRVSADARLVEEAELRVDQSTLTGESHPVRKTSRGRAPGRPGAQRAAQPGLRRDDRGRRHRPGGGLRHRDGHRVRHHRPPDADRGRDRPARCSGRWPASPASWRRWPPASASSSSSSPSGWPGSTRRPASSSPWA